MLPVSHTSSAIPYIPVGVVTGQLASVSNTHVGASSDHNIKMLKELTLQIFCCHAPDKLDNINAILSLYGHTSSIIDTRDLSQDIAANRMKANYSLNQFMAAKGKALKETTENKGSDDISVHSSYAELWTKIAAAIGNIKSDYVDFYADLMQSYTEMYEKYNDYVSGASSSAVSAGSNGNNVSFNADTMTNGYAKFNNWCNSRPHQYVDNWGHMTQEERDSMIATLQPAFKVSQNGEISFNLDAYHDCPDTPRVGGNGWEVSTASYQAWLATFNSVGSGLQSNMQAFAQRYSQANSTFDNLNKVLSGAISSLADSAKEVLKSLN